MALNRKDVRNAVYQLIKGSVPAVEVTNYQESTFDGKSPVVQVVSGGTHRQSTRSFKFPVMIGVHVFVLHSDPSSGWTELNAEDALDDIEVAIAELLAYNQNTSLWVSVTQEVPTMIDRVVISGVPYLYEMIPLVVEAKNG